MPQRGVRRAEAAATTVHTAGACPASRIKGWSFPKPKGGGGGVVVVVYPSCSSRPVEHTDTEVTRAGSPLMRTTLSD